MPRTTARWGIFGGTLALGLLLGGRTEAYTLHEESGQPARWRLPEVEFVVDASYLDLGPEAMSALEASFEAWSNVSGAYTPKFTLRTGAVDPIGYQPGKANLNTVRYLPEGYGPAGEGLMITVLTYDEFGAIVDADLVVNGGKKRPFGFVAEDAPNDAQGGRGDPGQGGQGDGQPKIFDVQNVMTHEIGHVLGLDEEPDLPEATMFPSSLPGEVKKRDLDADDEEGIRLLYAEPPPSGVSDSACALQAPSSGRGGRSTTSAGPCLLGLAVAVGALLRRRRRPRVDTPSAHVPAPNVSSRAES